MVVAPTTVMFEKLLLLLFMTLPDNELAVLENKVRTPPGPDLTKVPDIELPFTLWVPVAGTATLFKIKVIDPAVFTSMLVNVLLFITWLRVAAAFEI
jgi:hypothetical protein